MAQVKIGPHYFQKAKNDYANWKTAFGRELLQNSLDAPGTRHVHITIADDGPTITITVANDGAPMSRNELVNKLLALGESGKDFEGTVGGFGQAKLLIYLTHQSYQIRTGNWHVQGSGGEYDLTQTPDHHHGTASTIRMAAEPGLAANIEKSFRDCITMCQKPHVTFTINGEKVEGNLHKGKRRRAFTWGTVYTNKTYPNRLVIRIGGIPMFTKYADAADRCVVVELEGKSRDILTANRDGLQHPQAGELDEFIRQLTVDKTSAFREVTTTYTHFSGDRLRATTTQESMAGIVQAAYATQPQTPPADPEEETPILSVDHPVFLSESRDQPTRIDSSDRDAVANQFEGARKAGLPTISHEFIIKNNLGMKVPAHFSPYEFSNYSRRLVKIWAAVLLEVHRMFGDSQDFTVGFIFDEEREAEYEQSPDYGRVFYINPASVRFNSFCGRSLARRWKLNPDGRWMLVTIALHEYVHKARTWHDEGFASLFGERVAAALKDRSRFNKCFR